MYVDESRRRRRRYLAWRRCALVRQSRASGFALLFGGVELKSEHTHKKAFQNVVVVGSSKTKSLSSTRVVNLGYQKDIFRV